MRDASIYKAIVVVGRKIAPIAARVRFYVPVMLALPPPERIAGWIVYSHLSAYRLYRPVLHPG